MEGSVLVSTHPSVTQAVVVTLHTTRDTRPRFAITRQMWEQLHDAFVKIAADSEVRVAILRGAEGRFSAGANFYELQEVVRRDRVVGNTRAAHEYWRLINYANTAIENSPQPVIAVIESWALGAAFALALACDFRVAASDPDAHADKRRIARVGVPAAQKGLTLGLDDTRRLVSIVGAARAREILIEGREYSAEEAKEMGLLNWVVPAVELERRIESLARKLSSDYAPLAIKAAKANIAMIVRNPSFAGIDETSTPMAWAGTSDLEEGLAAFLEERRPHFEGR